MKRRTAPKNSCTRPQWWSCVLSVLVALFLVVQPSDICALIESAPGHSHPGASSHSHEASDSDSHHSAHSHDHHGGSTSGSSASHGHMSFTSPEAPHACCSSISSPQPVIAASSRAFQADESASVPVFAQATLPVSTDIFALTACHGRDGPPDKPLRSQFSYFSRLGRAPPRFS